MKTILFLETGIQGGGSFECLDQHIRTMDREKYQPVVVFVSRTRYLEKLRRSGIETKLIQDNVYSPETHDIIRYPNRLLWGIARKLLPGLFKPVVLTLQNSSVKRLENLISKYSVDLVHLNNRPDRHLFGIEAARRSDVHCVSHIRSIDISNFDKMAADFCNRHVDSYVAISKFVADRWVNQGIDQSKTEVVHDFIDPEPVEAAALQTEFNLQPESFVWVMAGRPTREKGIEFLLEAFSLQQQITPETKSHLVLLGGKVEEEKLRKLIRHHGLSNSVTLTDWVDDAKPYLKAADGVVVPSRYEGLGRVVLEAMAVETPVVATRVGGLPEATGQKAGLLVDFGDTEGLAKALNRVQTTPALKASLVKAGSDRISQKFSAEKYIAKIESIYNNILQ